MTLERCENGRLHTMQARSLSPGSTSLRSSSLLLLDELDRRRSSTVASLGRLNGAMLAFLVRILTELSDGLQHNDVDDG